MTLLAKIFLSAIIAFVVVAGATSYMKATAATAVGTIQGTPMTATHSTTDYSNVPVIRPQV